MELLAGLRDDGLLPDELKPSLFELLAEQQLAALLPPTLRYLLVAAAQRWPRHLLRVLNRFDEAYALAAVLIERHALRTRGAGFTEHFYGLRRERVLPGGGSGELPRARAGAPDAVRDVLRLTDGDVWRNLLVMVGVPYLKRRLDEAYEINAPRALMGAAYNRLPPNPTVRDRLLHYYRWFLRHVYPSVNAAYGFAVLAFNLAYLFDNSRYHHPLMWLVGTRMRRMTAADYRAIEDGLAKAAKRNSGGLPGPRSFFSTADMGPRLLSGLSLLLPTSVFALKFLEWWYASDFAKQLSRRATEDLNLPPPIVAGLPESAKASQKSATGSGDVAEKEQQEEEDDEGVVMVSERDGEDEGGKSAAAATHPQLSEDTAPIAAQSLLPVFTVAPPPRSDLCPICGDDITTPTACQTGIVYCYVCIHKWIAGTHPKQEDFIADKAGKWESGVGRCAVTGRRVLGGTEGLRRVMV